MHVLSKLHGKTFITRIILHVFICIVINFVVQMQTNINVKSRPIHCVVRGNPCVDVNCEGNDYSIIHRKFCVLMIQIIRRRKVKIIYEEGKPN